MSIRYFLLCCFLLCSAAIGAQVGRELWLHQLGREEGLINGAIINDVFQDSGGFIWIATESGLSRFDGRSLVHYTAGGGSTDSIPTHSLFRNRVTGNLFEDSRGNLWFCVDGAIQCYERKYDRFHSYRVEDSRRLPIATGYQALYLERDSFLWIKADTRFIFRFNIHDPDKFEQIAETVFDIDIFPGVGINGQLEYLFSVDGSKSAGIEVFPIGAGGRAGKPFSAFTPDDVDKPALNIHSVHFEAEGTAWLGADDGIYQWDLGSRQHTPFHRAPGLPKLITPLDSSAFIITENHSGLLLFNRNTGEYTSLNAQLINSPDPAVDVNAQLYESYVDPQGHIWSLIVGEGLVYAHPAKAKFRSIPKFPSLDGRRNYLFRAMVQTADGEVWCSTFYDGIFRLDASGRLLRHYHPGVPPLNSLDSRQVSHMIVTRDQQLWVATAGGVSYYDPVTDRFVPIPMEDGSPFSYATYLYETRSGEILVSSVQHGILAVVQGETSPVLQKRYLPIAGSKFYTTLYEDSLGTIYACRDMAEITILANHDSSLSPLIDQSISGKANAFFEAPDGRTLWIATASGLIALNKTSLDSLDYQLYRNEAGGLGCELRSLIMADQRAFWLGTSSGLALFDPVSLKFTHFSLADGACSREFHELAALRHSNGNIWFGGDKGITIVAADQVTMYAQGPLLHITNIKVNDERLAGLADSRSGATNVSVIKHLQFPYPENTLSFEFVAIDYSDPGNTRLRYYMEGVDKKWVEMERGEAGFARYPNLPPGDYVFRIKADNSDGIPGAAEKELHITITPPWYERLWARILFVLAGALAIFLFYRSRVQRIRKEEAFKRKEAEYRQLVAETETAVLRLQMNPHFIFNSMNSISSYISRKDADRAQDYLNRFAKLMRTILKLSAQPLITIAEEAELLDQYLRTESMRFRDAIDYEIEVSEELDPDEVFVPTMILQPFVENAIWHGLSGKEGDRKLRIHFQPQDGQLWCTVEDNGIGRSAAAKSKAASGTHESKAIAITRRRFDLMEEMEGDKSGMEIVDLLDEQGDAQGTRVIIRLPLLQD